MPYRLIQVGLGDFGRRWLDVAHDHPSWEYAALATRNAAARSACGDACGLPEDRRFATLGEALASGIEADAVLVTTPHFRHVHDVSLALQRGMHVLVEKPLAGDWRGCVEIFEASRTARGMLMVAENYRFGPGPRTAHEIVSSGQIGRPEFLSMDYFVGHEFPDGDWRNDYEYPLLVENATHQFDLVRYVTGANATEASCTAHGSSRTPHWPYPNISAHFTMTGGLHFDFSASWAYDELRTPWEGEWRLYGSTGAMRWGRDRIEVVAGGDSRVVAVESPDSDATLGATLEEFTAALDEGRPATTDIEDNMQTVAMVFAAMESSRRRMPVSIAEMLAARGA